MVSENQRTREFPLPAGRMPRGQFGITYNWTEDRSSIVNELVFKLFDGSIVSLTSDQQWNAVTSSTNSIYNTNIRPVKVVPTGTILTLIVP